MQYEKVNWNDFNVYSWYKPPYIISLKKKHIQKSRGTTSEWLLKLSNNSIWYMFSNDKQNTIFQTIVNQFCVKSLEKYLQPTALMNFCRYSCFVLWFPQPELTVPIQSLSNYRKSNEIAKYCFMSYYFVRFELYIFNGYPKTYVWNIDTNVK